MFLSQSKYQDDAFCDTARKNHTLIAQFLWKSQTPPFGGRNFRQIEGDGASRFTAFFTEMALVTCSVWRATRLV